MFEENAFEYTFEGIRNQKVIIFLRRISIS